MRPQIFQIPPRPTLLPKGHPAPGPRNSLLKPAWRGCPDPHREPSGKKLG